MPAPLFTDFDFQLLNDAGFKEDSVREELIAPLLKALGYSASPPNQIRRSVALTHPYVYIGTKKHPVTIIPDYLLSRSGKNLLVLDAKAPDADIRRSKHVEQAYSYAIHRDVRAPLFALCNGREFVLFHISRWPDVLSFKLTEIAEIWDRLVRLVGTDEEIKNATTKPDLGLHMLRLGFGFDQKGNRINQVFSLLDVDAVARLDESHYSLQSFVEMDGVVYLATFDFPAALLEKFFQSIAPPDLTAEIKAALARFPFMWRRTSATPGFVAAACKLSGTVHQNEAESYCPFEVRDFC